METSQDYHYLQMIGLIDYIPGSVLEVELVGRKLLMSFARLLSRKLVVLCTPTEVSACLPRFVHARCVDGPCVCSGDVAAYVAISKESIF